MTSSSGNQSRSHTSLRAGSGNNQHGSKEFCLYSPDNESLKSALGYVTKSSVGRSRTCVISIISKSPLNDIVRDQLIHNILASHIENHGRTARKYNRASPDKLIRVPPQSPDDRASGNNEPQVYGHTDLDHGLTVLTLDSFIDTSKLLDLCCDISASCRRKTDTSISSQLLRAWPGWNQNLLKTLLILFMMSHIVVFYSLEPTIDYSLIETLKVLEILRLKSMARLTDLFHTMGPSPNSTNRWPRDIRFGQPRPIFICNANYLGSEHIDLNPIRDRLEDQIYLLLRKSDLMGGIGKADKGSLLSDPGRDSFVFLDVSNDISNQSHVRSETTSARSFEQVSRLDRVTKESSELFGQEQSSQYFRKLIDRHIQVVKSSASRDAGKQSGRQAGIACLPKFDEFFKILLRLKSFLFPPLASWDPDHSGDDDLWWKSAKFLPDERRFVDIYDLNNIDELFSQRHCSKVKHAAMFLYQRALHASNFSDKNHLDSREAALQYYNDQARGPHRSSELDKLKDGIDNLWGRLRMLLPRDMPEENTTRQDFKSLMIGPCSSSQEGMKQHAANTTMESREIDGVKRDNKSISVSRRANGIIVMLRCDCGRETSLSIKPIDRRRKLERVDICRLND